MRSPTRTSEIARTSLESRSTVSEPAKQEEGEAAPIEGNKEAGTGVAVTYDPSASRDCTHAPTTYVSPTDAPEQVGLEYLFVVIVDPVYKKIYEDM